MQTQTIKCIKTHITTYSTFIEGYEYSIISRENTLYILDQKEYAFMFVPESKFAKEYFDNETLMCIILRGGYENWRLEN